MYVGRYILHNNAVSQYVLITCWIITWLFLPAESIRSWYEKKLIFLLSIIKVLTDNNTIPGFFQGKRFIFPGPTPTSFIAKIKWVTKPPKHTIVRFFSFPANINCWKITRKQKKSWNWVCIKIKKYNHELDASAGFGLFIKLNKNFPQNSRILLGIEGVVIRDSHLSLMANIFN